jgi:hypothetical protein
MAAIICIIALGIFPGIITGSMSTGVANADYDQGFLSGAGFAVRSELPTFTGVPFFPAVGMFVTWLFTIILVLGIKGFVVTYIMGGTTSIYFSLRRDVDGTEDSEIYVEGDDEFDEFDLPPVTPAEPKAEEKAEEEKAEEPAEEEKAEEPAEEEKAEEPAEEEKAEEPAEEEKTEEPAEAEKKEADEPAEEEPTEEEAEEEAEEEEKKEE